MLGRIDFFLAEAPGVLRERKVHADARQKLEERISHEPLGVIANISAWNYPYFVGGNVFIPALIAGNAVLYKPSEYATLTGLHVAAMLYEAGVPTDVFVPVIGGPAVGAALLRQPVDGVFFTGSYATGAKVGAAAGRRMAKVQLELGGKDPIYVCDDVDVQTAAAGIADGAFYNTGQSVLLGGARLRSSEDPRRFCQGVRVGGQGFQGRRPARRDELHRARSPAGLSSRFCADRSPTPSARAPRCSPAAVRSKARATGSSRRCSPMSIIAWR